MFCQQVRKWSDPIDNGANLLIAVPGGADGPGGCLVCAENFIIYKNQDHEEVSITAAMCGPFMARCACYMSTFGRSCP